MGHSHPLETRSYAASHGRTYSRTDGVPGSPRHLERTGEKKTTEKIGDDGKFNVGDIIYTSWGYDQTQYDFAQIVEISKTRKTVIAKRMKTKTVDHRRQTNGIVPTEAYGNKFRLYVREWRDRPTFRGQYPFIDGFNDSKRMGSFWPWDGKTVYETDSQFGH